MTIFGDSHDETNDGSANRADDLLETDQSENATPSAADSETVDPTLSYLVIPSLVDDAEAGASPSVAVPWASEVDHAKLKHAFVPGCTVQGRYRIENEIGRGGMGQVYLARDLRLGRRVAVKVCRLLSDAHGHDSSAREFAERTFEQEAQLGASLSHPAIATVYDYGFHEGCPFTVFEYLDGHTLRARMRQQPRMTLDEVQYIITPLARALDFAHAEHIVHCDLKPENIRCTQQVQFKILDLGLAKEFRRKLDWTGFEGTPAYTSPEQAVGQPCDGRTDQYALALIVFEMLSGNRVFTATEPLQLLDMHRTAEPRAVELETSIPIEVRRAILRALSKDPNQRFDSCTEFANAIGCLALDDVPHRAEVLREASVEHIATSWLTGGEGILGLGVFRHQQRLALTGNVLWVCQDDLVWRLPLALMKHIAPEVAAKDTPLDTHHEAETVRAVNRLRERHVMLLGTLYYLLGVMPVLIGSPITLTALAENRVTDVWVPFLFVAGGIGSIATGFGLRGLRGWGWWLGAVATSVVTAFFLLLTVMFAAVTLIEQTSGSRSPGGDIPPVLVIMLLTSMASGFVAGVYFLGLLFSRRGRFLFKPEYRKIKSSTRHMKSGALRGKAGTMTLSVAAPKGRRSWRFRFVSHSECHSWASHLAQLCQQPDLESGESANQPVAILGKRPPIALQVLGKVQSLGQRRGDTEAALRIKGAILGADAVAELQRLETPAFQGTMREMEGLAVKAVDNDGRNRLVGYWFARRARSIANWLLLVVSIDFVGNLISAIFLTAALSSAPENGSVNLWTDVVSVVLLIHVWPAATSCLLAWLRWPQLAYPVVLSVFALQGRMLIAPVVAVWNMELNVGLLCLLDPISWALLVISLLVARSARQSIRRLEAATEQIAEDYSTSRSVATYLAWAGSIAFIISLWGYTAIGTHYSPTIFDLLRQGVAPSGLQ